MNKHALFAASSLLLLLCAPLHAFVWLKGDKIGVASTEVVNDDLYACGRRIAIEGTVNGDVVAFGRDVVVDGIINGSLITAAQTIVINGSVTGSVRVAGSALFLGDKAKVGSDIVGAGYSLETRPGSTIGRDVTFAGKQLLLSGTLTRNLLTSADGVELDGQVGGNVNARVHDLGKPELGPPPNMYMQTSIPLPEVATGLIVSPQAKVNGELKYTQSKDLPFPANVIVGAVIRLPQKMVHSHGPANWPLDSLRMLLTFLVMGFVVVLVFPRASAKAAAGLSASPLKALGAGLLAFAVALVALLLVAIATVLGTMIFSSLTLSSLSATTLGIGLLCFFTLLVIFLLVMFFISKIIFGIALGAWIFSKSGSALAQHRFWPMLVGVAITCLAISLVSAPVMPSFLSWLLRYALALFGLGAIWLMARDFGKP